MISGPYRLVRRPIYSGILTAAGTAVALSRPWLPVVALSAAPFIP